ncbi:MAG: hypothetical protein M9921_00275 [Fimbriimonadaceae bacterium]|nr:hypothetical protein [Chthonomonadaceae bacterium]MCO5295270.1 hypothetical protein [Fimbriimonadaceae bacterium]
MKLRLLLAGTVVLASALSQAQPIGWVKDWDAAKKSAAASGKMIMLDFYTDW